MNQITPLRCAVGLFLASLFFLTSAQQNVSANSQGVSNTAATESNGNMYIKKGCHNCHGNVGQGSSSGKRLAEPVLEERQFYAIVRRPYGIMPAYAPEVLSDRELKEIYQYLQSLQSPELKDIELLQREND